MQRIDATHSTWLFDTERMRYCRIPKGIDPSSLPLEREWQPYYALEIDRVGLVHRGAERRPHAVAARVAASRPTISIPTAELELLREHTD